MKETFPAIIPKPVAMQLRDGVFQITRESVISIQSTDTAIEDIAKYLADFLESPMGFRLAITESKSASVANAIILQLASPDSSIPREGYSLEVTTNLVTLSAGDSSGLFHGIQTLLQLLPVEINSPLPLTRTEWSIPAVTIRDHPRYFWRGLMLDVCRHFMSKEFVFKFLDLMALHKLNTLHLHLCDDQGWRIEIKAFPKLTTVGSRRNSSPLPGDRDRLDGIPYGPWFYTQQDIREIVDYARRRAITIVPEIEMPGHAMAALASYPELSCTGGPHEVRSLWGIEKDVYCAGKESVFSFLERVLDEVLELFPSEFIHVGGDECPKDRWQACPDCQGRIRDEGLEDEHELQSYFIARMSRYLQSRGRRLIGWDEILEGGLAEGATVMSWRGVDGGQAAARQGHDVVMTPNTHCYLDYYQSEDRASEPEAIGGFLPLETVYGYDPSDIELSEEERKHIIGVQGNIWTEYMLSYRQVEYMVFPRASALAEAVWSPRESKDYADFVSRLRTHLRRLDLLNVNFRPL